MEQVILRVGDVLTRYRANSECLEHKIIEITNNGYVYKQCTPHARVLFHECEHWFVNGKKYHRDNLIIPQIETDNKVTLKIGDVFYSNPSRYSVSEDKFYRILDFKNGRIIRNESLDICIDKMEDHYWVNGKRYHRDDIIIPDHSGEVNEVVTMPDTDNINHPSHYAQDEIECINVIMQQCQHLNGVEGFLYGNIQKYIWRFKHKNGIEDLKKAQWYLNKLIEVVE